MKVRVPSPLFSYTKQQSVVDAAGTTLAEVVGDLDRRFPGMRFRMVDEQDRIRPHIKMFGAGQHVQTLAAPVTERDEVRIVAALSGG